MGYQDHDDDGLAPGHGTGALSLGSGLSLALTTLVRTLGFVLIAVGLWALVTVVFEAVGLYREPARIDAMVTSIERATGLAPIALAGPAQAEVDREVQTDTAPPPVQMRPAYFLGWFMAVLLFLVIGKLADWVISRGLALVQFGCRRP